MDKTGQVQSWINRFAAALQARDLAAVAQLFATDCYWRDLLAFTWNIKTLEGKAAIVHMLAATLDGTGPRNWRITEMDGATSAWIAFETATAVCTGRIVLRDGLAHIVFTAISDLHGHAERLGPTRPSGVLHKADRHRKTWSDQRRADTAALGYDVQPYVVIIGGGQGGLALGARLKSLGVPALIIEKNARAGDSWRNRYRSLVLHDPVWFDHMPYLPFPQSWPVFTPKDKMGDWLEAYASIFELNLWTSTVCESASFDGESWTVHVNRNGTSITLRPKQLVFATGAYGPPKPISLPGQDIFQGTLLHSSAYKTGLDHAGKTCVVIGAASSAHDLAADLWECGAHVTMIQRSPTIVVRSETLMELAFENYSEAAVVRGLTTEKADMLGASTPFALFTQQQQVLYQTIRTKDAIFYEGLSAAGFALDFGEDGSGLMVKGLRTASGFYIDVGTSDLISSGEIKVIAGQGVAAFTEHGVQLTDGHEIFADVVVACTGYQSMHETVAAIVSRKAADCVGPCWGLGSGIKGDPGPWLGELRNMWKPTAHPALWFHGGNLALSRFYSRFVALQLKARMEGIFTPVYGFDQTEDAK